MNRIRKLCLWLIGLFPLYAGAQSLTLEECLDRSRTNWPAIRQYRLIEQSRDYTLANAARGWLPQVSLSAGAYAFTRPLAENPRLEAQGFDLNQAVANGTVTINQTLYDGGRIAAERQTTRAQAEVERHRLDVDLYEVDARVEQLFFGILLLDVYLEQNRLLQADLEISQKNIESLRQGGLADEGDRETIEVERLKANQQHVALESSRGAYLRMLGTFTGQALNDTTRLRHPVSLNPLPLLGEHDPIGRPEMGWFTAQRQLLEQQSRQLNVRLRPTLSAFGTALLHTQVNDLINNGMILGGVSLRWNIGAFYTRKNDLRLIRLRQERVDSEQALFLFNHRLQRQETNGEIESLRRQIKEDESIVRLRERLRRRSEQRTQMGTESVNELLRSINAVSEARLQKALREIQLTQALYKLKHINAK